MWPFAITQVRCFSGQKTNKKNTKIKTKKCCGKTQNQLQNNTNQQHTQRQKPFRTTAKKPKQKCLTEKTKALTRRSRSNKTHKERALNRHHHGSPHQQKTKVLKDEPAMSLTLLLTLVFPSRLQSRKEAAQRQPDLQVSARDLHNITNSSKLELQ